MNSFQEAIAAVATNLADIDPTDPMGLAVGNLDDQKAAAEAQEVDVSTYGNMQSHFDGAPVPSPTCCSCCSTCPAPPPWAPWCGKPTASGPC